jgi:hypothetical protein
MPEPLQDGTLNIYRSAEVKAMASPEEEGVPPALNVFVRFHVDVYTRDRDPEYATTPWVMLDGIVLGKLSAQFAAVEATLKAWKPGEPPPKLDAPGVTIIPGGPTN